MGNCEGTTAQLNSNTANTDSFGDKMWGLHYKNDVIEINGNKITCNEYEESCIIMLQQPTKTQDQQQFKLSFDPNAGVIILYNRKSVGLGIVDFEIMKDSDYTGQTNYGLGHGMWFAYSDKQISASNNLDQDKKPLGFQMNNNDIIHCERNGLEFKIYKNNDALNSVTFQLDDNRTYHFGAYMFAGWNSERGEIDKIEIEVI